jgi:4'-phosphopantetheinyl transferase EntD
VTGFPLRLFPTGIHVERMTVPSPEIPLFPEEAQAVRNAVPARRAQFEAGRACARQALRALGAPAVAIPVGPHREPVWPAGIVGSISHAGLHAAAAVAWSRHYRALGLDIEEVGDMEADALALIATDAEVRAAALRIPANCAGRLVFSAKESVFKCLFPLLGRFIGFHEVVLHLEGDDFHIELAGTSGDSGVAAALRGAWCIEGSLIVTGAWLAPPDATAGPSLSARSASR